MIFQGADAPTCCYHGVVKSWIFAALILLAPLAKADPTPPSWDEDRLAGFSEHSASEKIYDQEREKGRRAFLEEEEQWQQERMNAATEYRKIKKLQSPTEEGPEYKTNLEKRAARKEEANKIREEYVKYKAVIAARHSQRVAVTPEEELNLQKIRPRYELKKRVLYGAAAKKSGSSSSAYFPPSSSGGSSGGFTPPPYDPGNGVNNGFAQPNMPDFDEMPPPPPPPLPGGFDEGGFGGDFPPPPPADFSDFPPPPPMMPQTPEGF